MQACLDIAQLVTLRNTLTASYFPPIQKLWKQQRNKNTNPWTASTDYLNVALRQKHKVLKKKKCLTTTTNNSPDYQSPSNNNDNSTITSDLLHQHFSDYVNDVLSFWRQVINNNDSDVVNKINDIIYQLYLSVNEYSG